MKIFRREFLIFIGGILSLGLLGYFVNRRLKRQPSIPDTTNELVDDFVLPKEAYLVDHRLKSLVFRIDRKQKMVCAFDEKSGVLVWESHGEERFIIPGAAFPIDLSHDGELWVANVGKKRLEQLDPQTGRFIASWEPIQPFGGCCNPVRFAALTGGRFVTMEKGMRQACIYQPSGELERVISSDLSDSEFNYFLCRVDEKINLYDTGIKKYWEVS